MPRARKKPTRSRAAKWWWTALAVPAALALATGVAFVATIEAGEARDVLPCRDRVMATDVSSLGRTDEFRDGTVEWATQLAVDAAVCETDLSVVAVRGGGVVRPLLTTTDIDGFTPEGPTAKIRASRFDPADETAIVDLVAERLDAALAEGDGAEHLSLPALYTAAAERSEPDTEVILLTHGVHTEGEVDLNRPLVAGEGVELADRVAVPPINARRVIVVGVAQVDSITAPPGATWVTEVRSFNESVCRSAGADVCAVLSTATPKEALS